MGIEPTWDALQRPTPGLKPGSPTSELGASEDRNVANMTGFDKALLWQALLWEKPLRLQEEPKAVIR